MSGLLAAGRSQLLVVDVQQKLAPATMGADEVVANVRLLAQAAVRLGIPITVSEQYPKGLGSTLVSVAEACGGSAHFAEKVHFSCAKDPALAQRIIALDRPQIVVCGLEAHVCVLQSAIDFASLGRDVFVVADAVASRRPESKEIALRRLASAKVTLATAEMVIFEWLERAGSDNFRALAPLLR